MNPQVSAHREAGRQYSGLPGLGEPVDGDAWLTPLWILDHLGKFDLDPCAADSQPQRCAGIAYIKSMNGLTAPWGTLRVFMNPPFSNTVPWLEKHAIHGLGISLVPASVESQVWRKFVWPRAAAITLLHGRTRFCNPDGTTTTGRPLRSVALIAWAAADADILAAAPFAGVLLTRWRWQS